MPDKNTKKAGLTVNQKPVSVTFECPHCGKTHEIEYSQFVQQYGLPSDWGLITCPACLNKVIVDNIEWD